MKCSVAHSTCRTVAAAQQERVGGLDRMQAERHPVNPATPQTRDGGRFQARSRLRGPKHRAQREGSRQQQLPHLRPSPRRAQPLHVASTPSEGNRARNSRRAHLECRTRLACRLRQKRDRRMTSPQMGHIRLAQRPCCFGGKSSRLSICAAVHSLSGRDDLESLSSHATSTSKNTSG